MPATDDFSSYSNGPSDPGEHLAIPTFSDSTDLANVSRLLLWVAAGAVRVTTVGGETVTIPSLAAGTQLALRVTRVWSTGTTVTAGNLLVVW